MATYSRKTGCDCHEQTPGLMHDSDGNVIGEKSMSDRDFLAPLIDSDYSPEYQDAYLPIPRRAGGAMTLKAEYLANNGGNVDAAMVEMVADLMAGDAESFKAGYSRANAVLAVADVFGTEARFVDSLVEDAMAVDLAADVERRRAERARSDAARLNALQTGTYKAGE